MYQLKYRTIGNCSPQEKEKVYCTAHPEDFNKYFEDIISDIFNSHNCAIYFDTDLEIERYIEDLNENLGQMQLFVIPITSRFLHEPNRAREIELRYAIEHNIPVLPLMQEPGLDRLFNRICGDIQFLDKHVCDITSIPYEEKLRVFLNSVLLGDELAQQIREAFDAYIFMSYRKKDRKYAQELMRLIHMNDFCRDIAIWYDEFLVPGENFNKAIELALEKSDLFALVVTPNLLERNEKGEDNYVMRVEYPEACKAKKTIMPVEMIETDCMALKGRYEGLPNVVNSRMQNTLKESLLAHFKEIAIREHNDDPKHVFFIGLAYLNGIDVEKDYERALNLISFAAGKDLPEAIEQLITMYDSGYGTKRDESKSYSWKLRKIALLENRSFETLSLEEKLELADTYFSVAQYHASKIDKTKSKEAKQEYIKVLKMYEQCSIESENKASISNRQLKVMRMLAIWHEEHGNRHIAYALYKQLISLRRNDVEEISSAHTRYSLIDSLLDLGIYYAKEGDVENALPCMKESMQLCLAVMDGVDKYSKILKPFQLKYVDICNRTAGFLELNEEYEEALLYNELAINTIHELNNEFFELYYAKALLCRSLILIATHSESNEKIVDTISQAINIYDANINNLVAEEWLDYLVAQYKLANVYRRNGEYQQSKEWYDKCLNSIDRVKDAFATEAFLSQIAVIYLDCGSLYCALDGRRGDFDKALSVWENAKKIYADLAETIPDKYDRCLEKVNEHIETVLSLKEEAKINNMENNDLNNDTLKMIQYAMQMEKLSEQGFRCERTQKPLLAIQYYMDALKTAETLEKLGSSPLYLAKADLYERIGSQYAVLDKKEDAWLYYQKAYAVTELDMKDGASEDALSTLALICDKMGTISETAEKREKYYSIMLKIRMTLADAEKSRENLDALAYASYKLSLSNPDEPNMFWLDNACNIWKMLYDATQDLEYEKWYQIAQKAKNSYT